MISHLSGCNPVKPIQHKTFSIYCVGVAHRSASHRYSGIEYDFFCLLITHTHREIPIDIGVETARIVLLT